MTDATVGAISYQFKADTSSLKAGLDGIKAQFQQAGAAAKQQGQELTNSLKSVEAAAASTAARIKDFGEKVGNAAYNYGPWTGANVTIVQGVGTALVQAMARATVGVRILSIALGTAALATVGLGAMVLMSRETIAELGQLDGAAKLAGVSLQQLQNLQRAAVMSGGTRDGMTTALQGIAKAANDASRDENEFSKILDANGIKLKDNEGNLRSTMSLLADYANLVRNAKTEQDKLVLLSAIGSDKDMISFFEQGAEKIKEVQSAAEKAGAAIDDGMVKRAHEFDIGWKTTMDNFSIGWKSAIMNVVSLFDKLQAKMTDIGNSDIFRRLVEWMDSKGLIDKPGEGFRGKGGVGASADAPWAGALDTGTIPGMTPTGSASAAKDALKKYFNPASTVIPSDKSSGGGSKAAKDTADAKDSIDRYIDSLNKAKDVAQAESETWMLSNVERAKAVALAQAKAAADRDGLTLSEKQKKEIADTAVETQNLHDKTKGLEQSSQAMGDAFANAMDQLIVKGGKLNDTLKSLLQNMASSVLKGALMGEGSFASIFGGAAGSGGLIGGGLKSLFSGFKADGGPVMGGKAYVVGERGPELFQPNGGGSIVPNVGGSSGGGAQQHININLAGANGDAAIMRAVQQGVSAGLGHFSSAVLPGRINEIQLRGG
jgi:hypothetical protein